MQTTTAFRKIEIVNIILTGIMIALLCVGFAYAQEKGTASEAKSLLLAKDY